MSIRGFKDGKCLKTPNWKKLKADCDDGKRWDGVCPVGGRICFEVKIQMLTNDAKSEIIFHSDWELGAIASNPTGRDPTAATGDVGTCVCGCVTALGRLSSLGVRWVV